MHLTLANSLTSTIGKIFHPVFEVIATLLAWIYGLIPNYAVAIALLTLLIMAALTPLTVKSTKSMLAMQKLQPEMKKLQQKYKGAENRQQLNDEMMKLYKEHSVNPASSCIPLFLQMPFFIVLYDTIKGLTNTVKTSSQSACAMPLKVKGVYADPRYIPHTSTMFHHLCSSGGNMYAFGINLALKPTSYHTSFWAALPYYALVLVSCGLQYVQMAQMNRRNPSAMQANPQMKNMQYFMPIIFAVIYVNVQSGVVIYMIVSTLVRIVTQDLLFRTGVVQMPTEREVPASGTTKTTGTKTTGIAKSTGTAKSTGGTKGSSGTSGNGAAKKRTTNRPSSGGGAAAKAQGNGEHPDDEDAADEADEAATPTTKAEGKNPSASARPPAKRTASGSTTGSKPGNGRVKSNGASVSSSDADGDDDADGGAAKPQNRSRSKRTRKAR